MRSANAKVGRAHPTPAGRAVAPPGWGCASPAVLDACARGHSGSVVPATAMTAAVADAMTPAMPAVASAVIRISRITAVASRIAAVPTRTADAAAIVARRIGAAGVGGALPCQASLKVGDRRLSHTGGAQLLQFLGCQGEAKRTRVALQLLDQGSVQRGLRAKAQDPGHCQRVADGGSQWWRRGATRRHQRGQKQRNASEFLAHDTPSVCGRHCVDLRRRRTFLIVEGWASALGVHQHAPSEMASFLGDFIHHPK